MLNLLIVEDNDRLRTALKSGLLEVEDIASVEGCPSGEEAVKICINQPPDTIIMDVLLAGELNGIQAAIEIRREFPRLPVVFYSIQDEDAYYRDFRRSGILSHYAYVRKSNHLLPEMILRLVKDAISGRSYIDPEIETRVHEVRQKDEHSPLALLEPGEQEVALMLAKGMTNEQIAARLGFRDKRTISRTNGQIYSAWGLNITKTDEKIARTRAAIIAQTERMLKWDEKGEAWILNGKGEWKPWGGE
ncbi:MAG: response regulator transcription factor [Chloroflexi bacterium]|nr:response regulator transcription factor [Chloroflexota bacterium]